MKKCIFLFSAIIGLGVTINAQNDTMYIIKNGEVIGKYDVNTGIDSIIFYMPAEATSGLFTDSRDGNVYHWVKIGDQMWMAENLRYLPSVVGPGTSSSTTPYYYVYNYDGTDVNVAKATSYYSTYGVLYNWPAAMDGSSSSSSNPSGVRGVCPSGWHLPSDSEWVELFDYLGGTSVAGGKLKETGTTHWNSPNTGATNESGFTAIGSGDRYSMGFASLHVTCFIWSATEINSDYGNGPDIGYNRSDVGMTQYHKSLGKSVRCLKD